MILINNIFVEESILSTSFCCNLSKCYGACCVEGESGAPLNTEELEQLEKIYPKVKNYLPEKNQKILENQGLYVKDEDGDWTTTLTSKNGPCAFAVFKNNIAYCSIEQAYKDKKINWQKPISCHLYPVRVEYKNNFIYLRYHQWNICKPALQSKIPMFRFLKDALIRAFGENFYEQLEHIYKTQYENIAKPLQK